MAGAARLIVNAGRSSTADRGYPQCHPEYLTDSKGDTRGRTVAHVTIGARDRGVCAFGCLTDECRVGVTPDASGQRDRSDSHRKNSEKHQGGGDNGYGRGKPLRAHNSHGLLSCEPGFDGTLRCKNHTIARAFPGV